MNKKQIKDLALSNGFKLKEQPSGEMDLNPYVYEFASALIAKANERVRELESQVEFKIKECVELAQACSRYKTRAEQLRKEQNQC